MVGQRLANFISLLISYHFLSSFLLISYHFLIYVGSPTQLKNQDGWVCCTASSQQSTE